MARKQVAVAMVAGLVLGGLPLIAVAAWPQAGVALWWLACLGVGFGILEVTLLTLTQRLIPADVLARVYGLQETLTISAMALGSAFASGLVLALGERGALLVPGLLLPAVAVVIIARRDPLSMGPSASHADYELLRGVAPFATLPVATVENLAVRADSVAMASGAEVVRQGDPGNSFFVVGSGRVDILKNGRLDAQLGPGNFFGEIALLHGSPRNATVRATTALELLVVDRQDAPWPGCGRAAARSNHSRAVTATSRSAPPTESRPCQQRICARWPRSGSWSR